MQELDAFIDQFAGLTEEYLFYGGTEVLRYEPKSHRYFLIEDGQFIPLAGVTNVVHIIDKSDVLIPWACKQMANKLLAETPTNPPLVEGAPVRVKPMRWQDFEKLILAAKTAHKDKLEEAADIGHTAHAWIEQYIKAEIANDRNRRDYLLGNLPEEKRARNCCIAALDWMSRHNVRWIHTEKKIYSRKYRYAGTMDGLALTDSCDDPNCCGHKFVDHISLIDWKSSNYLYTEYLLQSAAYLQAYEEEFPTVHIHDRWIIRLGKEDGKFDPWYLPRQDYSDDFLGFRLALRLGQSIDRLEERQKSRADERRKLRKAAAKAAKEAALRIKCKSAEKYKGVRPPKCNGGNPCETCLRKYEERQAGRIESSSVSK